MTSRGACSEFSQTLQQRILWIMDSTHHNYLSSTARLFWISWRQEDWVLLCLQHQKLTARTHGLSDGTGNVESLDHILCQKHGRTSLYYSRAHIIVQAGKRSISNPSRTLLLRHNIIECFQVWRHVLSMNGHACIGGGMCVLWLTVRWVVDPWSDTLRYKSILYVGCWGNVRGLI